MWSGLKGSIKRLLFGYMAWVIRDQGTNGLSSLCSPPCLAAYYSYFASFWLTYFD